MKKILLFLFLITTAASLKAEDLVWVNKLDKAYEISQKTHKPMMLFFTGSDWCGWCKRLVKEVFSQPEFAAWAKENVVLVEIDFPRFTPLEADLQNQNNELQQLFQVNGFPTIWFVNPSVAEGKLNLAQIGTTGYRQGGPQAWIEAANEILKNK